MSLNDQLLSDMLAVCNTDEFGETVTYKTYVNPTTFTSASVVAIVFRSPPERISESPVGLAYSVEVYIPKSVVTSIQAGKDKISLADKYGATATDHIVSQVINSDAGGWHLGLRG